MSKDNGGPAFPMGANEYSGTGPECGMTLRDYFAAKAMLAILGSVKPGGWNIGVNGTKNEAVGLAAYAVADAMLEARK